MRNETVARLVSFSSCLLLLFLGVNSFAARNAPVTTAAARVACPGSSVAIPLTVNGFVSVSAITLRIEYDPTKATFSNGAPNSSLPGMSVTSVPISPTLAKIIVLWASISPVTLPANATLLTITMKNITGSTALTFNNTSGGGGDCEYADESGYAMIDNPAANFYINGSISTEAVGAADPVTGSNTVCAGANSVAYSIPAVFNATAYAWSLPVGFTIVSGLNTHTITVSVSSSAVSGNISVTPSNSCTSGTPSPDFSVTVNPSLPVSVSIAASANPVCSGTSVTFTAVPVNGGMTPGYQWRVNGTNTGTNNEVYACTPVNGDVVTCVLTSGAASCITGSPALSNPLILTVHPLPAAAITGASNVCAGSVTPLSATGNWNMVTWASSNPAIATVGPDGLVAGLSVGTATMTLTVVDGNGCQNTFIHGMTVVLPPILVLSSAAGSDAQIVEANASITPITYTVSSGATGAEVSGLPAGVSGNFNGATVTIAGSPSFTGIYPYTISATGGACGATATGTIAVVGKISGYVTYDNAGSTGMIGVNVRLRNSSGNIIATAVTTYDGIGTAGYYIFAGLPAGNYSLTADYSGAWLGNNATDALIVNRNTVGTYPLFGLRAVVADINGDGLITGLDALMIKDRAVGYLNSYPAGDWKFTSTTVVIGTNTTADLKALCTGDVNGSNIPD